VGLLQPLVMVPISLDTACGGWKLSANEGHPEMGTAFARGAGGVNW